ncbi:hypothetical protein [Dongia sp. agr-C8]
MKHSRTALFPISLSNQKFSSKIVFPAIELMLGRYQKIVFLVADQLQLFNRAASADASADLSRVMKGFSYDSNTLNERRAWLERLRLRMGERSVGLEWRILGVDEVADRRCYKILRNVIVAYHVLPPFRSDVDIAAWEHVRHSSKTAENSVHHSLSVSYIIEEIALSLRLRVVGKILDEYYVGSTLPPVLKLYDGKYPIDVYTLSGVKKREEHYNFFDLTMTMRDFRWDQVEIDS